MDLGIEGRVALVMGASKGLGRGAAEALAREGARVAISSRSEETLREAAGEIGAGVDVFPADTDDLERMAALPGEVEERMGPVEILVLNTGGPPAGLALDASREEWEAAERSLVGAPRALVEAALPGMREAEWGRIVNIASTSVSEPIDGLALSNVYRPAAHGFLMTLAREVAADGVTANTIATGRFETERQAWHGSMEQARERAREEVPAGRLGQPEEYGDLVAFLCSERARYLTGALIPLDGGMTRGS